MKWAASLRFFFLYLYHYLWKAQGRYRIHSPFVFSFYSDVILKKETNSFFHRIEEIRKKFRADVTSISFTEYGSPIFTSNSKNRTICSIARKSLKNKKWSQLLYRIVSYQQPTYLLDLGTSLGITTAYQAKAAFPLSIYTFEGCSSVASYAQSVFSELDLKNIQLIEGNLDVTLQLIVNQLPRIDYVFFDANHQYSSTIDYFSICLAKADDHTIFIFDDIYHSKEMERAWKKIKEHSRVRATIDLFFLGIVFFNPNLSKQDFVLKA